MKTRTLVIANIGETFKEFLSRASDPLVRSRLIYSEQRLGDRALLWLEDPKLVITPFPVPHIEYIRRELGYKNTKHAFPVSPSYSLCCDILRENHLLKKIIEYSKNADTLQIIPYATTSEFLALVDELSSKIQANIVLPESPSKEALWVRDYADTKVGFRSLIAELLTRFDAMLPEGYIAANSREAALIAKWFVYRKQSCILKANCGENGIGNMIVHPTDFYSFNDLCKQIESFDFFRNDIILIEDYIHGEKLISPSIEFFVPPIEEGNPAMTYLSNQIFRNTNNFCGIEINPYLFQEPWYLKISQIGVLIANELQGIGYVGHFDLDAVVDDLGQVHPVEINTRRTGGTHVHEFAKFMFGSQYVSRFTLLSDDSVPSPYVATFEDLIQRLNGILFPIGKQLSGVVPTVTSSLSRGLFGCIIVALSPSEAWNLYNEMINRVTA